MRVRVKVPAKINLWLEVIGKRPDGYHELSSLMLPVGIYDSIDMEIEEGDGIALTCNHPDVPQDAGNLAWRAAERYFDRYGKRKGLRIVLTKDIPVGAGLGGGSADAAGVLLGLNELFGKIFSLDELGAIAGGLGADVPFFLHQYPALATGIGEKLERVEGVPSYPLVLIKPPFMVSTRWVYESFTLTRNESRIKVSGLKAHPWQLRNFMENDLETVTLHQYPLLAQIKEWLLQQGAHGALMSGSGPTVFGVFGDMEQAEKVGAMAKHRWDGCWISAAEVIGSDG